MKRKKLLSAGMVLLCLLASCTSRGHGFRDGFYSAIAKDWDDMGWKEYITICVNNRVITTVEYGAVNQGGYVKAWDSNYMRVMKSAAGTYPLEYGRYYAGELLRTQGGGTIDCLSGATSSWHSFRLLAGAVLENARAGDASMALVALDAPPEEEGPDRE